MSMATTTLPNDLPVAEPPMEFEQSVIAGVFAEFDNVDDVWAAGEKVRDAGFTRWDIHAPFPIHGIDEVLGMKPTILPWICLGGGLAGLAGGMFLCLWTMATSWDPAGGLQGYEYLISGKPLLSIPQYIPVVFETTILLAAFSAGLGMLGLNALPLLYNPLFKHERFRRATDDRFFVVIDSTDSKFDENETPRLLQETKPITIEMVLD